MNPAWPLLVYALGGLALYHVLYDRMDIAMTALLTASLALLVAQRVHWTIAFAVLAAAVNFKLVPIVLAPAFVIGATPVDATRDLRRFVGVLAVRSITLLALCALLLLPFILLAGRDALRFLDYHAARGVQVESVPANLLLLTRQVTGLAYTHGAVDVISPAARAMSIASTAATALVLGAISIWMIAWALRAAFPTADRGAEGEVDHTTLAQAYPRQTVVFATLLLWAAMATAKVFSPQYVLWLLPLAPLALPNRVAGAVFFLVCALTTVIFPHRYYTDIVRVAEAFKLLPPTALGVSLLTLRNGLFVALLVALARAQRGQCGRRPWRRVLRRIERFGARG